MVLNKKGPEITKGFIFSKITPFSIYAYYIPGIQLKQAICSPIRRDRSPSFVLYLSDSGVRHCDMAYVDDSRFSGSATDFVMQMFGLNLDKALRKICKDFNLLSGQKDYENVTKNIIHPLLNIKRNCFIQVSAKKFTDTDLNYWKEYEIDKDQLKKEDIYSIKEYYINRRKQFIDKNELAFCYKYHTGMKLYFPSRSKQSGERWKSSISTKIVENLEAIKNKSKIIITKAKKDRIILSNLFPDIAIINTQNESKSCFTNELLEQLQGKQVWLNFDRDLPGKEASLKITNEYNWIKHVNVPDNFNPIKDFSDMLKMGYKTEIIEHFKKKNIID